MESYNAVYIALIAGPVTVYLTWYLNRYGKNADTKIERERQLLIEIDKLKKENSDLDKEWETKYEIKCKELDQESKAHFLARLQAEKELRKLEGEFYAYRLSTNKRR